MNTTAMTKEIRDEITEAFDKFYNQGLDHAIETIKTAVKVNSLSPVAAHILIKAISTLKK